MKRVGAPKGGGEEARVSGVIVGVLHRKPIFRSNRRRSILACLDSCIAQIRYSPMRRLVLLVALLVLPTGVQAKCATIAYTIAGIVTDHEGAPVAQAGIQASWIEVGQFWRAAQTTTDASGRYRLDFRFYPWSKTSFLRGDICNTRLSAVAVAVSAAGFVALKTDVPFQATLAQANHVLLRPDTP